jgi:hypothetical protein
MDDDAAVSVTALARGAGADPRCRGARAERDDKWPPAAGVLLATLFSGFSWAAILFGLRLLVG